MILAKESLSRLCILPNNSFISILSLYYRVFFQTIFLPFFISTYRHKEGFKNLDIRGFHPLWHAFPRNVSTSIIKIRPIPLSLTTTYGISVDFFIATKMFQFAILYRLQQFLLILLIIY